MRRRVWAVRRSDVDENIGVLRAAEVRAQERLVLRVRALRRDLRAVRRGRTRGRDVLREDDGRMRGDRRVLLAVPADRRGGRQVIEKRDTKSERRTAGGTRAAKCNFEQRHQFCHLTTQIRPPLSCRFEPRIFVGVFYENRRGNVVCEKFLACFAARLSPPTPPHFTDRCKTSPGRS